VIPFRFKTKLYFGYYGNNCSSNKLIDFSNPSSMQFMRHFHGSVLQNLFSLDLTLCSSLDS
jgi:hypothetical protein